MNKNIILFIVVITSFMTPFLLSAVNVALPDIQSEFSVDAVTLSWVTTAFLLSTSVFLVPVGKLSDIYGRKKLFIIGVIVATLSNILTVFISNIEQLIFLRIIQGIGGAMIMTTGVSILTSVFPPKERGRALGIVVASVYIGLSTGPFIGGILTEYVGWRSIFLLTIPFGVISLLAILTKIKEEWADAAGEKFDILGSVLYGIALILFMCGISFIKHLYGIITIISGIVFFIIFIKWELKVGYPVFEIKLFSKNKLFAYSNYAALINYAATFSVMFLLSLYLQNIKGMSPKEAGLILIIQPIIQAIFSPFAGKLSDRIDPGIIASIGMSINAVGLISFALLSSNSSYYHISFSLALMGFGFALFSSPNMNAIMGSVEKVHYGIASGASSTMRLLGQMFSMGVVTITFVFMMSGKQISPDSIEEFMRSLKVAFVVFSIFCCIGVFFSLNRKKVILNKDI